MGWAIMHLPECDVVLGDERDIENAKRETGRAWFDENHMQQCQGCNGLGNKPLMKLGE